MSSSGLTYGEQRASNDLCREINVVGIRDGDDTYTLNKIGAYVLGTTLNTYIVTYRH